MNAKLVFALSVFIHCCNGRYFNGRVFEHQPGIPLRDSVLMDEGIPLRDSVLMDEVCEDDPAYADGCPKYAAIEGYCKDQEDFMRKNCPVSCGYCSKATTQPALSTEPVKPPAPAVVCEDDSAYAADCPQYAAIEGYCKDQEDFMRKNCPESCGYCSKATTQPPASTESAKPPAPVVCEDDPAYADGCPEYAAIEGYCKDQEDFMRKNCLESCGYCSKATQQLASLECKDDPEYEDKCKDIAETAGFCEEQKEFTQKHCSLTCGWCEPPVTKAPIEEICEKDLPKWAAKCPKWAEAGQCEEPEKQVFMEHYCRRSCKLPCKTEPSLIPTTKPPSPPAFCRDRDVNCAKWESLGLCDYPSQQAQMAIYCGVTCDICKAPTPDECYDKSDNCEDLKKAGFCASTVPTVEYEVKTNCLETCEFCVPDYP